MSFEVYFWLCTGKKLHRRMIILTIRYMYQIKVIFYYCIDLQSITFGTQFELLLLKYLVPKVELLRLATLLNQN